MRSEKMLSTWVFRSAKTPMAPCQPGDVDTLIYECSNGCFSPVLAMMSVQPASSLNFRNVDDVLEPLPQTPDHDTLDHSRCFLDPDPTFKMKIGPIDRAPVPLQTYMATKSYGG